MQATLRRFRVRRLLAVTLLGTLFLAPLVALGIAYHTPHTTTGTVEHKERFCESGNACYWMVFTNEGEYVNRDSWLHLKWSSTTLQREMRVGETYTLTYYGWRIPFFSMYPNLTKAE